MEYNFLTQLMMEPSREGALLSRLFVNRGGLVGDVTALDCLGHNSHKMIEFSVAGKVKMGVKELPPLTFSWQTSACFSNCWMECLGRQS